jgi:subtilisin family serine protease
MKANVVRWLALASLLYCQSAYGQNYEYSPTAQQNLAQIGVTSQLHDQINGAGIGIADVDGPYLAAHQDLAGNVVPVVPYAGNFSQYTTAPFTISPPNHAVHVMGIIAGARNGNGIVGVAPGASLYNYAVFDSFGWIARTGNKYSSRPDSGLDRVFGDILSRNAAGANIRVVNLEYSGGPWISADELRSFARFTAEFVITKPAGNDGSYMASMEFPWDARDSLGHFLIVGSVDESNRMSPFSNRPGQACFYRKPSIGKRAVCGAMVKEFFVVAPGERIASSVVRNDAQGRPVSAYERWSGTSMAAPHVAGIAALVFQDAAKRGVFLSPTQVANAIKQGAIDLGAPGVDGEFGWGLANAPGALAKARNAPSFTLAATLASGGTAGVTTPSISTGGMKLTAFYGVSAVELPSESMSGSRTFTTAQAGVAASFGSIDAIASHGAGATMLRLGVRF